VYPERVLEYPALDDLDALAGFEHATRIRTRIEKIEVGPDGDLVERFASEPGPDARSLGFYELCECPGTKVGGKPAVVKDGRRFEHLVTLSTWETDAASFRRWLAVEDQRLLAPPGEPLTWARLSRECDFQAFQGVLGATRPDPVDARICLPRE
jgi:hypothetical protein